MRTAEVLRAFFLEHPAIDISEAGQYVAHLGGEHTGYALHPDAHKLVGHFWSADANLVRRIVGIREAGSGRLELEVMRLGQARPSRLTLAARNAPRQRQDRLAFRQAIVAAAQQEWQGWRLAAEHGGAPERSAVQRLLFRRQRQMLACVALQDDNSTSHAAAGALVAVAQALVWAEQCRAREPGAVLSGVRLILPRGGESWLRLLRAGLQAAPVIDCYVCDRSGGRLEPVALSDGGNSASLLRRAPADHGLSADCAALLARVRAQCPEATWETTNDGCGAIAVYGLEIARQSVEAETAAFVFGAGGEQTPLLPETEELFARWLAAVAAARVPGGHPRQPLYAVQPERWMSHILRHEPSLLDARLRRQPIYAEIPMLTPVGSGVLDLLACDSDGRLVVIELKASENLEFPLQGLLYWMQVRQHQQQGDFERLGYFPGQAISPLPPRLWLVAPALQWHPKTAFLVKWLRAEVPIERIGVNEEWRQRLQCIYRKGPGNS